MSPPKGAGQQSADDSSGLDAWRDAGCDPQAMESWLAHRDASGKPLPGHARIFAAQILRGMGDAATQRTAVKTAIGNNWQSLRVSDGADGSAPKRAASAADRITWRPDPEEERRALEASGAK